MAVFVKIDELKSIKVGIENVACCRGSRLTRKTIGQSSVMTVTQAVR